MRKATTLEQKIVRLALGLDEAEIKRSILILKEIKSHKFGHRRKARAKVAEVASANAK